VRACGRIEGRPAAVASRPRHATARPGTRRDARPARGGHTRVHRRPVAEPANTLPSPCGACMWRRGWPSRQGLIDEMLAGVWSSSPFGVGSWRWREGEGNGWESSSSGGGSRARVARRDASTRAGPRRAVAERPRARGSWSVSFRGMESTNPDVWWWVWVVVVVVLLLQCSTPPP